MHDLYILTFPHYSNHFYCFTLTVSIAGAKMAPQSVY